MPMRTEPGADRELALLVEAYRTAYAVDMHWPADRFANESDPMKVLAAAAEALGRGVGVTRAFYAEIDHVADTVHIALDWTDGVPSRVGTYPFGSRSTPVQRMLRDGVTVVEDVDSPEVEPDLAAINKANEAYAWIAMPLMEGGRPIALVGVSNATPRRFSDADVQFVREVANRTWHALVHVRTLERLRESQRAMAARAQHEQFFRAVGDEIAGDRADATILFKIAAMLSRHLGVEEVAFLEPDATHAMRMLLYRPLPDPCADRAVRVIELPAANAGWRAALDQGRVLVSGSDAAPGTVALWHGPSAIAAPVADGGVARLVLAVESLSPRQWSEADVRLVRDLADLAWSAVRRVRIEAIVTARERNQTLLLAWNDAVRSARDAEAVIDATLALLETSFGDVATSYSEYDGDGQRLRDIRIRRDGRTQRDPGPVDPSVLGPLPSSDALGTIAIEDAATDPHLSDTARAAYRDFGIVAALIAPIVDQGRVVALLAMHSDRPRAWPTNERQVLRDLADRVWSLLLRLRAEDELARREADQAFLIEWSDAVRDAIDPDQIIAQTLRHLTYRFGGTTVCLDELDDGGDSFARGWCWNSGQLDIAPDTIALDALGADLARRLLHGETVAIEDPADAALPPPYRRRGKGALLAVPILSGGRTIAVLTLHAAEPRRWSANDRRVVRELAERVWSTLDRVRGQVALTRSRAALGQAERMAALGAVLGGISHELNNPLAVVTAQAQLIALLAENTELAERANRVHEAGERCARIIRNFAAVARQAPPDRHLARPADIVARAVRQVEAQGDVTIGRDAMVPLPDVMVDPDHIHQILVNLLANARQAMLRARTARPTITVRASAADAMVRIDVADDGPGIPADVRDRIFEPFFTTKPVGEGTGMGLALAQGLAELHGGSLALLPSRSGATFRLILPASP